MEGRESSWKQEPISAAKRRCFAALMGSCWKK